MTIGFLLFQLYRFIVLPITLFFLKLIRSTLPKKIQTVIEERFETQQTELPARPIWIHASSGEIEYAKSVIREIKELWPQQPILVSYFSPSAKSLIKNFPGVDAIIPLPWDTIKNVKTFLSHYKPIAVLIARTDVWPEFSFQCHQQSIPQLLFSCTMTESSARTKGLAQLFNRFIFSNLNEIHCVSENDKSELLKIVHERKIKVFGDTRFDQVLFRLRNPKKIKLEKSKTKATLILGSTWPADEVQLWPALNLWLQSKHGIIWAPHEVSEHQISRIKQGLTENGISFSLYSDLPDKHLCFSKESVILVDTVGLLAELYTMADLAFVGGSFKAKVHSVMEPIAAGCPVLVGPFFKNNREAIHFSKLKLPNGKNLVISSHDHEELAYNLNSWIKFFDGLGVSESSPIDNSKELISQKDFLGHLIKNSSGATSQVLSWLGQNKK